MARGTLRQAEIPQARWPDPEPLIRAVRAKLPALLFGLRVWLAVCLSLYVVFWLELDNAFWAATSAAIVSQPSLGASLRRGWYRVVGTVIGAVAIVVLTAFTVQDRGAYLLLLAVWGAVCAFAATVLRNFASQAAALAGYTAVLIANSQLGVSSSANGDVFMIAISRATETTIGIVCAGVVLGATDFGGARRKLAGQFATLANEISARLSRTFLMSPAELKTLRPVRRDLTRRVIALDQVIDEAIGESSELRYHTTVLRAAMGGLFSALSAWRIIAVHLERASGGQVRLEAQRVHRQWPDSLSAGPSAGNAALWSDDPARVCRAADAAVRSLDALPDREPSARLLADRAAEGLLGLRRTINGLLLIDNPARASHRVPSARFVLPDLLPAFVSAFRVLATIGALELFWILTAWPNGALAITFGSIIVILFAPLSERASGMTMSFLLGTVLTAVIAAIIVFAILPGAETFPALCLALAVVMVPAGAMLTQTWRLPVFTAMTITYVPLLSPSNPMVFNVQQYYNSTLAIVLGIGTAALAFLLLPPPSPALRTRRILTRALRDLRRLVAEPMSHSIDWWRIRTFMRLAEMPEQAEPLQRSQLLAALSVGIGMIRLGRVARRFSLTAPFDAARAALARGDCAGAEEHLAAFDRDLAAMPDAAPGARARSRARGRVLAIFEALAEHHAFFAAETAA
jgi:uncharacterized membrane protein YccC